MISEPVSAAGIIALARARLQACYDAISGIQQFKAWIDTTTDADLTDTNGLGFSAEYAAALRKAFTDADAVRIFILTGQPPADYPQPPSGYPYIDSMFVITGPGQV